MRGLWLIVVGIVMAAGLAGMMLFGVTSMGQDDEAEAPQVEGDVWRLNETTTLTLIESHHERDRGRLRLVSSKYEKEWETGTSLWFGHPCIMGSYPEQYVIVPYITGHGTGVAEFDWVLVRLGEKPVFEEMGLWRYWCVSRHSEEFRLTPLLTWGTGDGEPCLEFSYETTREGVTRTISGVVIIRAQRGGDRPFGLVPARRDDALACVELLSCSGWGVGRFAADALEVIADEELRDFVKQHAAGQETEKKLHAAIERHFTGAE
ncbi:MAG: hypothetical protein JW889_01945 [Verrucomicrobia bacterium]|nr:hypothetical protein [Verrucomicrobiota bacterium]